MKDVIDDFFGQLNKFSAEKINAMRDFYARYLNNAVVSIYVTGSFGRGEARVGSDLDVFLLRDSSTSTKDGSVEQAKEVTLKMIHELELPPLDGNGKYLISHEPIAMTSKIGSSSDDFENHFTARMLLLLESRSVYNDDLRNQCMRSVLDLYFRDMDDSNRNKFRPVFLINDIVRYWRTICLNYESRRTGYLSREKDPKNRAIQKLKNKKLKFNRIWLIFTTLIPLVSKDFWDIDQVLEILEKPPFERLKIICQSLGTEDLFYKAAGVYQNFLQEISNSAKKVSLDDPENAIWGSLNAMASNFRSQIISIIESCPNEAKSYLYI